MNVEKLKEVYKYINFYNNTKTKSLKSRFFINTETDIKFGIAETDDEVVISFYTSKNSFKFIKGYSEYRKKHETEGLSEPEKSAKVFSEYTLNVCGVDKTIEYYRNIKLNNPLRNVRLSNKVIGCETNDMNIYSEFFLDKSKYYIHSGFIALFNSISNFFYETVNKYLKYSNKKIVIIGFSFSSVIARLAYLSYVLAHPDKLDRVKCFLFSTPNMGNSYFEKFYTKLHNKEKNRRLYIINCNDDCIYNLLSKRFGFFNTKSTLLIKTNNEEKRIYNSIEYATIIKNIIQNK
ncbi:MAG: lipase family protein [Anaeroplasmataceae bacterium]